MKAVLPEGYSYRVKTYESKKPENFCGAPKTAFDATIFCNIFSEQEVMKWLRMFQDKSFCTYRVTRGTKTTGSILVYKTVRHCQHFRKYVSRQGMKNMKSVRQKKTQCPSTLTIKVYSSRSSIKKRLQFPNHPCEIQLHYHHNHPTESAHALSFRDVSESTKEAYYRYFQNGHSAATARHHHELKFSRFNLLLSLPKDEIEPALADRSINPQPNDVSRLFLKWRETQHGPANGDKMFECLEAEVKRYNSETGGKAFVQRCVKRSQSESWEQTVNQPMIIAICTPLMQRAHQYIKQSSELVFCDSTSSLDQFNCPTFILSTSSPCGAVPLGIVITSGESAPIISEAFGKLKSILPENAFNGNSPAVGPSTFITDDSQVERESLGIVWPYSRLLLCIFHYLQAWWRWLWGKENAIDKEDRIPIMNCIKRLLYSESPEEYDKMYKDMLENESSPFLYYENALKRLQDAHERRSEWAITFRRHELTRGNHTNNYAESGIRIIKDQIFERTKAFNPVQMFQFFTTTFELYYERRLLDLAHNRISPSIAKHFYRSKELHGAVAIHLTSNYYLVKYEGEDGRAYHVDADLGMCTCPIGINGQPCKHQHFVASHFSLHLPNLAPIHSKSGRQLLAVVAVGKERIQSLEFYSSLHEQSLQESLDSSAVNPDDPDINETVISDSGPDESGTSNANPDESGMKDTGECDIKEFSIKESEYNDPDESGISLEQAITSVKTTLKDIFIDIQSRLDPTNLDTSFFNGIVKFTE